MTDFFKRVFDYWQDSLSMLLGVWLFFSGWILAFTGITWAFWLAMAFGVVLFAIAFMALAMFQEWEEWVGMLIGVLLVISPWLFGFAALTSGVDIAAGAVAATWNMVIVGVLTFLLASTGLVNHRTHEGHVA